MRVVENEGGNYSVFFDGDASIVDVGRELVRGALGESDTLAVAVLVILELPLKFVGPGYDSIIVRAQKNVNMLRNNILFPLALPTIPHGKVGLRRV